MLLASKSDLTVQRASDESQMPAYEALAEAVLSALAAGLGRRVFPWALVVWGRAGTCRRIVGWSVCVRESRADASDQSDGADSGRNALRKLLHAHAPSFGLCSLIELRSPGRIRRSQSYLLTADLSGHSQAWIQRRGFDGGGVVLQQPFSYGALHGGSAISVATSSRAERQRLGHQMPSSFNMVRSSGRLMPTTL